MVSVYLKVTVPAAIILTTPEGVTVATVLLSPAHVPPVFGVKVTVPPTQTELVLIVETGRGPTAIVKFIGEPVQPSKEGVTVNTELTDVDNVLSVKNEAIFPVPESASAVALIFVLVLDQVYTAAGLFPDGILPVNVTASEFTPAHFN